MAAIAMLLLIGIAGVWLLAYSLCRAPDLPEPAARTPRRIRGACGRIHSTREDVPMEHATPNCTGFWALAVDNGLGPRWIHCPKCRQYYVTTEKRTAEAKRQNSFALDMMVEASKGAALLAAERLEGAR